jgi:hypothetical protein
MKSKIVQITAMICVIGTIACNNPTPEKASGLSEKSVDSLLVPESIANADIKAFDSMSMAMVPGSKEAPIIAYTVSADELLAAMGIDRSKIPDSLIKYNNIRTYLGYHADPSGKTPSGFKLYIAAVEGADIANNKAGIDILFNKNGKPIPKNGSQTKLLGDEEGYYFDLNAPCPHSCPEVPPGLSVKNQDNKKQ